MEPVLDLTKEYGIVLDGGGARGAYQIGAWKALKEAGVKINAVAVRSLDQDYLAFAKLSIDRPLHVRFIE